MQSSRYFIRLAYKGTQYHGWQVQPNAPSVQQLLNKALQTYFRTPVETVGCGRTDAGVHAAQFYAHFNLPQGVTVPPGAAHSVNALLPYDIVVHAITPVPQTAHARFDALTRSYTYHMHSVPDPFRHNLSWYQPLPLNVQLMQQAAQMLCGFTNFSSFSRTHTQTFTNNCRITRAGFTQANNQLVFTITADRFLRNMVRAIMGTLIMVGREVITPGQVADIINAQNRSAAGQSVPACGLYLTSITYPYPIE